MSLCWEERGIFSKVVNIEVICGCTVLVKPCVGIIHWSDWPRHRLDLWPLMRLWQRELWWHQLHYYRQQTSFSEHVNSSDFPQWWILSLIRHTHSLITTRKWLSLPFWFHSVNVSLSSLRSPLPTVFYRFEFEFTLSFYSIVTNQTSTSKYSASHRTLTCPHLIYFTSFLSVICSMVTMIQCCLQLIQSSIRSHMRIFDPYVLWQCVSIMLKNLHFTRIKS